jgi:hypothetical protein
MEMILLDWTRMGRSYCLAGVVREDGRWRVVRPLPSKDRNAPVRNVGWSPYQLDGHQRWEVFELDPAESATPQAPHLEDLYVTALWMHDRPSDCEFAPRDQRRAILEATVPPAGEPLFGAPLTPTRKGAYLMPGTGTRSLTTVIVRGNQIRFFPPFRREGAAEMNLRVEVPLPELKGKQLMVKDHHFLRRVEAAATDPEGQKAAATEAVRQMGEQVAVRLGLSRPFQATEGRGSGFCWLMADGFFSLADPQS